MTTVLLDGRKLPHQDWEGDDFTPGAGGRYVTCTDTALGRMVAYATNGRVNKDGRVYRSAVIPADSNGINLQQAKIAARKVAGVDLIIPEAWNWSEVVAHLRAKKGLIIQGWYDAIPRSYRFQARADFGHAMFISHIVSSPGSRNWDPLDPNLTHHGSWVPSKYIRDFMLKLAAKEGLSSERLFCAYVPLQHL